MQCSSISVIEDAPCVIGRESLPIIQHMQTPHRQLPHRPFPSLPCHFTHTVTYLRSVKPGSSQTRLGSNQCGVLARCPLPGLTMTMLLLETKFGLHKRFYWIAFLSDVGKFASNATRCLLPKIHWCQLGYKSDESSLQWFYSQGEVSISVCYYFFSHFYCTSNEFIPTQ